MDQDANKFGDTWNKRYYKDFIRYYETHNYDGSIRAGTRNVLVSPKQQSVERSRSSAVELLLASVRWNELS